MKLARLAFDVSDVTGENISTYHLGSGEYAGLAFEVGGVQPSGSIVVRVEGKVYIALMGSIVQSIIRAHIEQEGGK